MIIEHGFVSAEVWAGKATTAMRRYELQELHYITAIENTASILQDGILSHKRSKGVVHRSLSKQLVQERRRQVIIPGGRPLHEYANLYVSARNPTLRKMIGNVGHEEVCVLKVSTDVLDLQGVVITDQNAAALQYCRYAASPEGLSIVDRDMVFAESWIHDHPAATHRHKSVKCAEVLVPDRVHPSLILGAYVSCDETKDRLQSTVTGLQIEINRHLFFR